MLYTGLSLVGDEDHPQYVQPPVIPGHEFFGEVIKLGKGLCYVLYILTIEIKASLPYCYVLKNMCLLVHPR